MLVRVKLCPVRRLATVRAKDSRSHAAIARRLTNTSRADLGSSRSTTRLPTAGESFLRLSSCQVVLGLRDSHRTPLYLRLIGLRPVPIQRTRTLGWLVEAGVLMHLH